MNAEPRLVATSTGAYAAFLRLYPKEYQEEFGQEQTLVFHDLCLDTYRHHGLLGITTLWIATILDLTHCAVAEQMLERREAKRRAQEKLPRGDAESWKIIFQRTKPVPVADFWIREGDFWMEVRVSDGSRHVHHMEVRVSDRSRYLRRSATWRKTPNS